MGGWGRGEMAIWRVCVGVRREMEVLEREVEELREECGERDED